MNDTFAMIIGNLIGKNKIAPDISPNKTWEGAICGVLLSSAIASIYYLNIIGNISVIKIVLLTILLAVAGQIGDLVFSKIKREYNLKDFSHIMPGHGGILDRIDSIVFVILTFTIIYTLF